MTPAKDHAALLLTRPAADSARLAALALARIGPRQVVISPMMAVVPLPLPPLPRVAAVVLTSAHAVAALADWPARPPAFCVGERTADAARQAGFPLVATAPDAVRLLPLIRAARPGPLLHARGRHAAVDLAAALAEDGIAVAEAVVYDQPRQPLTPAARALLAGAVPVLLPLFSARTARLLAEDLPEGATAPLWIAAISEAVAAAAEPLSPRRIEVADRPELAAMLDALDRLATDEAAG